MQNIRCWCDRIGSKENCQTAFYRSCNEAIGQCLVTHNAPVTARFNLCFFYLVLGSKSFCSVAIVIACPQCFEITFQYIWFATKLLLQEFLCIFHIPVIHPIEKTQDKHILGPVLFL